jgi:hypothetical protein
MTAGMVAGYFFLPVLQSYWLLMPFYILTGIFVVKAYFLKQQQGGLMKSVKSYNEAIQLSLLVGALGIFVFTYYTIEPQLGEHQKRLESMLVGDLEGETTQAAKNTVKIQQQLLSKIVGTPEYLGLVLKREEDPHIESFVVLMESIQKQVNSPAYQTKTKKAVKQQFSGNIEKILEQRIPYWSVVVGNWHIFHALILTTTFLFIRSILFRPLTVVYAVGISKLASVF